MSRSAAAVLLVLLGTSVRADTVHLRDGRKIEGVVREVTDGHLHLDTDFAGGIKIPWSKVAGLETEHPIRIWLGDGRRLKGHAGFGEAGRLLLREEGNDLPVAIPLEDIDRLNDPGVVWKGNLSLSLKVEDGNSDSSSVYLSAELVREADWSRLVFRAHGGLEEKEEVETERNVYALGKFDFLFSSLVYAYASDEHKVDRFEDLVFRNVASLGAGVLLSKEEDLDAWIEAGPAFISEELRDGTSDEWFGGRVAAHFRLKLPVGLELRDDATIYPNFETWKDWQFHNEASLSTRLGAGWRLSLSVISDWDNVPAPGKTEEDNKYVAGLGFEF